MMNAVLVYANRLAKAVVSRHYPAELRYFELVWGEIESQLDNIDFASERIRLKANLTDMSPLQAAEYGSRSFMAPLVAHLSILTAAELDRLGQLPPRSLFEKCVFKLCTDLGICTETCIELHRRIVNEVFAAVGSGEQRRDEGVREGSRTNNEFWEKTVATSGAYVDMLWKGDCTRAKRVSKTEAAKLKSTKRQYDLVVDETDGSISGAIGTDECRRLGRSVAATLWLVLSHVGHTIPLSKIGQVFECEEKPQQIYLYRNGLLKQFDEKLRDRMISNAINGRYQVPLTGWSFLWLRTYKSPIYSELIAWYLDHGNLRHFDMAHYEFI